MPNTLETGFEFILPGGETLQLRVHDPRPWITEWEKLPVVMRLFALTMSFFITDPTELSVFDRWVKQGGQLDETITWGPQSIVTHDLSGPDMFVDMLGMIRQLIGNGFSLQQIREHLGRIRVGIALDHAQESHNGNPEADIAVMFERNMPRLILLRWIADFLEGALWPSIMGICHQIIQEYWGEVVAIFRRGKRVTISKNEHTGGLQAGDLVTPESMLILDSHASNGGGFFQFVIGGGGPRALRSWFVQTITMAIPRVTNVRLVGQLEPGVDAKSLVAALTNFLGNDRVLKGSVIEYSGPGLDTLSTDDRCTLANQGPEYGALMVIVRFGKEVLNHLHRTGRSPVLVSLLEQYCDRLGLSNLVEETLVYTHTREFDLASVVAQAATNNQSKFSVPISGLVASIRGFCLGKFDKMYSACQFVIAIAAITSCTSTGNPRMVVEAALVARAADELGLQVPVWVKAMFAPGSASASIYLERFDLLKFFEHIGFKAGGIACTYCLGKSGQLYQAFYTKVATMAAKGIEAMAMAITSSNRPFDKRIHKEARINTNLSPAWVVIFALKGYIFDPVNQPLAIVNGRNVYATELFPAPEVVAHYVEQIGPEDYAQTYSSAVLAGDQQFQAIPRQSVETLFEPGEENHWVSIPDYTTCKRFAPNGDVPQVYKARCLGVYGNGLTTDGLAPNFSVIEDSPMWNYLMAEGMTPAQIRHYKISDFRSKDAAMRMAVLSGGDAYNLMANGKTGMTTHVLTGEKQFLYLVAKAYDDLHINKFIMALNDYGSGSSRVWGVKGLTFSNIPLVLSKNTDPIHSQNLVDMGVVNLLFGNGEDYTTLDLDGFETYSFYFNGELVPGQIVMVEAEKSDGTLVSFETTVAARTQADCQTIIKGGFIEACVNGAAAIMRTA